MTPKTPLAVIFSFLAIQLSFSQTNPALQHPRDQIALQLGAIQMGYTVPFQLVSGNATNAQQAANALLMGRNALDATVAKPAAKVQGFVDSPAVDTVEYRDQLYQAVEAVVTSPVRGAVKGSVSLVGSNRKQSVTATLTAPPNSYTIPVPFAVEANSSVTSLDAQAIISGQLPIPATSLPAMQVVTQNTTAAPNRSYFVPDFNLSVSLPANASVGDVVTVFGKGGKVKAPSQQGISSWTLRRIPGFEPGVDFDIKCSSDASKIYIDTNQKIYGSQDSGKTWVVLTESEGGLILWNCSDDGTILLAGEMGGDRFLISKDAGNSWSELNLGNRPRRAVGMSPDGSRLFQWGSDGDGQNANSIMVSTNGGATWTSRSLPSGVELDELSGVRFSGDGRTIVFKHAGEAGEYLFISNNFGVSWIDSRGGLGMLGYESSFAVSRDGNSIVVFDFESGSGEKYRALSTDAGTTWNRSGYEAPVFTTTDSNEGVVYGIRGFQDGKFLYSNSGHGSGTSFKSFDKGSQWNYLDVDISPPHLRPAMREIVAASFNGDRFIARHEGLAGIYTSWTDELTLDGNKPLNLIYLGNGTWAGADSN